MPNSPFNLFSDPSQKHLNFAVEPLERREMRAGDLSSLGGQVLLTGDNADLASAGLVFNNIIRLSGSDNHGNEVSRVTTTDIFGNYAFHGLESGTYQIQQIQPDEALDGDEVAGDLGGVVGNDIISEIEIDSAGDYRGYDFNENVAATVIGTVYLDGNNNGKLDFNESGIEGVKLQLTGIDDRGNSVSLEATTNQFGTYEFDGLRSGEYKVSEIQPEGFVDTGVSIGTLNGVRDGDSVGNIQIGAGQIGYDYDFGENRAASLSGRVFVDHDQDRVSDDEDGVIAGVLITLTGVDNFGNAVEIQAFTDENGEYSFQNLRPGTYEIREQQPLDAIDSVENLGRFEGENRQTSRNGVRGDDVFSRIRLENGDVGLDYDFGESFTYGFSDSFSSTEIVIEGTDGDDVFEFHAGSDTHTYFLNGEMHEIEAVPGTQVIFHGRGGDDSVILIGTEGIERATLNRHDGVLQGDDWRVSAFEAERIEMFGGGGNDVAFLNDTIGDDRLKATESYARMWGDDYYNQATGFHRTYATATKGEDRAYFHDSQRDDTFKADDSLARMFSRKYYNAASNFDRVYAYANSGGEDTLRLWDSKARRDVLEAFPDYTRMYNSHFYNYGEGFEKVIVDASAGGADDRAHLHDSAGDDTLISTPATTGLVGAEFSYEVSNFERVYAYATEGDDSALLYDSKRRDNFVAQGLEVKFYNSRFYLKATGFNDVDAFSSGNGKDRAYFHDTASHDGLLAHERQIIMFNGSYNNASHGFSRAYVYAKNGGFDRAKIFDSDQADTLKIRGNTVRAYSRKHFTQLQGFELVNTAFNDLSQHDRAIIFGSVTDYKIRQSRHLAVWITRYGGGSIFNPEGGVHEGGDETLL